MAHFFSVQIITKILVLILLVNTYNAKAYPSSNSSSYETQDDHLAEQPYIMSNADSSENTRLIPLPHMLCTGLSIGGKIHSCFPVGCMCDKGKGICNLLNKCVKFPFHKELDGAAAHQEKEESI